MMNIRRCLITALAAWLLPFSLQAQEENYRLAYDQAMSEYRLGRVEQAMTILESNIGTFKGSLKESGFRLMSLCCLALDQPEDAERYAALLLDHDPYFSTSMDDPQRFIDLINSIKAGLSATITTASSQEEKLEEVPVPTTLITEEMIRNSGARNLQEVLAAYVPGMHIIDCNDGINISMRGIYSNSQEKILIMLNGHRMNSYCTNVAAPDFSISLEKLKQIEVLRGPASSLYGGVALTAVVNLITKKGADVDGIEVKGGIGNYRQMRADLLFGKRYFDLALLVWGSIYGNKGEEREAPEPESIYGMPEEYVTIGRIGNKPSYDFGFQLSWKDLDFLFDTHFSEVVPPLTLSTLALSYDHDKYKTFNGFSPSTATKSSHLDLRYNHQFGKLNLTGSLTYDNFDLTRYQVFYDYELGDLATIFGLPERLVETFREYTGTGRFLNGLEQTFGAHLKGDVCYINNSYGKGFVTFGADYTHFNLEDMRFQLVYNFKSTTPENHLLEDLGKDHENSYDIFAQMKHQWGPFIVNAGLRYDRKIHYDHTKLGELSPRLALIYVKPKWNIKLSYSKSFVDAPYFYRKSNDFNEMTHQTISDENGDESSTIITDNSYNNLSPEILHSFQLTFAGNEWIKGLNFEINGFYNNAKDLIFTLISEYYNGGRNKMMGLELMANYHQPRFRADFNLTWTHTLRNNLMPENLLFDILLPSNIDDNNNTPAIMSNVLLTWKATKHLKLFSHIAFEGKQTSYNMDFVKFAQAVNYIRISEITREWDIKDSEWYENMALELLQESIYQGKMDSRLIFNLGAECQWKKLTLGLNIHNLFNTHYYQSGMNTKLVPQKGRWLMATVAYKF